VSKDEIAFVILVDSQQNDNGDVLKFVTASNDGFVKMNEFDLKANTYQCKKSFFVSQSGISVACQLSG
jgi:hypothetical protein